MKVENHMIGEIHCRRYVSDNPSYAILISHGLGGHGGMYDRFGTHQAAKGADVWSYDAPGHGQSTSTRPRGKFEMQEWVDAGLSYIEYIHSNTGLPVFTLGSSLGVAAAYTCLASDHAIGAITMGASLIPGTPPFERMAAPHRGEGIPALLAAMGRAARFDVGSFVSYDEDYGYKGAEQQKRQDPWITWSYDLASMHSFFNYSPQIPVTKNAKPILVTAGSKDAMFSVEQIESMARAIAGPVDVEIIEGGSHQLLMFDTERFSKAVSGFVGRLL